tara:strand:+ start:182 stop:529 length:348 start_codon:yes stop_codon:yes gene_type:complete
MGIHGRAPQYEHLRELTCIGETKGQSVAHIGMEVFRICKEYAQENNLVIRKKMHLVQRVFRDLEIDMQYLESNKKSIYAGKFSTTPPDVAVIFQDWLRTASWRQRVLKHRHHQMP